MATATVTLFHDTRRATNKLSFVRLSVYFERKQKLFSTGEKVSVEDWNFLDRTKAGLPGTVKDEDRRRLWRRFYGHYIDESGKARDGYLIRAQTVINKLGEKFSFDAFADELANYGKGQEIAAEKTDLIEALFRKAGEMRQMGRLGNAINYELAAKSLRRFVNSFNNEERKEWLNIPIPRKAPQIKQEAVLRFEHLTADFLNVYEKWMQHYGKSAQSELKAATGASLTTVGIYLRHVRAVVNDAIEEGLMSRENYPFTRSRYVIPAGTNIKKALQKADIEKIKAYQPIPGTIEQRSQDLWLLSYFCNGANLTDICRLTWGQVDLKGQKLTFIRQKTARSKKQNQTPIIAHLRPETLAILERWGTTERRADNYLFPFLNTEMSDHQKKQTVHQVIKMTNKWMGRISKELGIEADTNTYSARHSFATTLLKSKAPLAFISKQLGHTNLKTTESYLGSFDDDEAREFLKAL